VWILLQSNSLCVFSTTVLYVLTRFDNGADTAQVNYCKFKFAAWAKSK
jgi:hypothetical protein